MGKLSFIIKEKCPRCGEGDLFQHKQYLPISKKAFEMHKYCPNCGVKYEKEPGFFYGAMFVSYALNIALFVACLIVYLLFFQKYGWLALGIAYLVLAILSTAVLFRYSRAIWVNAYFKYDPTKKDKMNIEKELAK